jgi:hypothetical protein
MELPNLFPAIGTIPSAGTLEGIRKQSLQIFSFK